MFPETVQIKVHNFSLNPIVVKGNNFLCDGEKLQVFRTEVLRKISGS